MSDRGTAIERRALLVAKTPSYHQILTPALRAAGYRVDLASNALDAVTAASLVAYPLVISERRLPGSDGYWLLERLRVSSPCSAFLVVDDAVGADCLADAPPRTFDGPLFEKSRSLEATLAVIKTAAQHSGRPTGEVERQPDAPIQILLVDTHARDIRLMKRYLARVLGSRGHRCTVVSTIAAAFSAIEAGSFDLIFLELLLGDSIGLDAIEQLRRVVTNVAIVVLTAADDDELGAAAIERGAQDYLVKDQLDTRLLKRTIRYALERVRAHQRIWRNAYFDSLTGLANRLAFEEEVARSVERAKLHIEHSVLMLLDLDRFKSINDNYGHHSGDQLLVQVAARIKQSTDASDTVARLGGDEFAILLHEGAKGDRCRQVASTIIEALARPVQVDGMFLVVTASIGIAACRGECSSSDDLMRAADAAMYEAKAAGRNRYHIAAASRYTTTPVQRLQNDLRRAVAEREFFVMYQPQIELSSRRAVAVEALIRWRQPDGTVMMPDTFIPQLEDTGLIREVGLWTMKTVCKEVALLRSAPLDHLRAAINLSAYELIPELPRLLDATLCETGLHPGRVELEVTEGALMRDTRLARRVLNEIQEMGVRVAIDDFGTGYSSLAYLEKFRITTLKLDKSFIQSYRPGARSSVMLSGIIALGKRLELEVVAEGVETDGQLRFLCDEGCTLGQGYIFSKPVLMSECVRPPEGGHYLL